MTACVRLLRRVRRVAATGEEGCGVDSPETILPPSRTDHAPRRRRHDRLLELDEVERRLKPFGRRYLGLREIQLDALVGTDSRAHSFTRDFRPLHAFSRDRLRSLERAFADGPFPPIVAVKLGEAYFVIDGHHRTALARRSGAETIDADVTELIARVPLPVGADMLEVVLRELERIFLEDSGLAEARPGLRISVSRPAHYLELLENIQVHGYHLMRGLGHVLENAEIAADWHDAIYTPTLTAVDRLRLARGYRDAPPGDLFLVLHRHRRDAFPSAGCPHLAQTVAPVISDAARRRQRRLPGRGRRSPSVRPPAQAVEDQAESDLDVTLPRLERGRVPR
jgi:hypothetical protein